MAVNALETGKGGNDAPIPLVYVVLCTQVIGQEKQEVAEGCTERAVGGEGVARAQVA